MTTLCEIYSSQAAAQQAGEALRAASVPDRDIRLLTGSRYHDVRSELVGGFAGAVGPDAPVGSYAGLPRPRWHAAGGFHGEPDRQRQGSFADAERNLVLTYDRADERSHLVSGRGVGRLLREANMTGETAGRIAAELHQGHAVLLAEVVEIAPRQTQTRLQGLAHAA
jgi:hypothetical protein